MVVVLSFLFAHRAEHETLVTSIFKRNTYNHKTCDCNSHIIANGKSETPVVEQIKVVDVLDHSKAII